MRVMRFIPDNTAIPFMRFRNIAFVISGLLVLLSFSLVAVKGLAFGIDFRGGILVEVGTPEPADLAQMRTSLGALGIGDIQLQEFGSPTDVLIRIQRQEGDQAAQIVAVELVKDTLRADIGEGISFRRTEYVGPKVSGELLEAGRNAVLISLIAVLFYIWFRFEWQFGVGAIVALVHDVALTLGLFAGLGMEFNLSTVAAVLTIVGYSLNDTVVVFDRVRENLRRYKALNTPDLIDRSINETLARTVVTSLTTLLALGALFFFGGEVIKGFTFAMIWGVIVGTYSSIFIAAPLLPLLNIRRGTDAPVPAKKAGAAS